MMVWCHAHHCDNLIRNDREHFEEEPANRTYVDVSGVPFCMECYDDTLPQPHVAGVPVREDDVTIVLGGYPKRADSLAETDGVDE